MKNDLRVLIVDDEKMVREGIVATLPWNEIHMEVVGTASNGRDALDLVRKMKPHIVLTDVKMPFLDGLGLIEAIHREAPQIRTVILSAYDDFEYVRKALQLGAVDYLIKPIHAEELLSILNKTAESFKEDLHREISLSEIRRRVRNLISQYIECLRECKIDQSLIFLRELFPTTLSGVGMCARDILTIYVEELHFYGAIPISSMERLLSDIHTSSVLLQSPSDLDAFLEIMSLSIHDHIAKNIHPRIPPIIQKVLDHVPERYAGTITVQGIAKWIGLNPDYFSHVFKTYVGMNFIEYINRYRIDRAEELLKRTSLKVYEIAKQVGFQDYKYFVKLFHQWKGYRPTDARNFYKEIP